MSFHSWLKGVPLINNDGGMIKLGFVSSGVGWWFDC